MSCGLSSSTIINPRKLGSTSICASLSVAYGNRIRSRQARCQPLGKPCNLILTSSERRKARLKLADKAKAKLGPDAEDTIPRTTTTPVILADPYGLSTVRPLQNGVDVNILCVAGGSGITFVLPVLQLLFHEPRKALSEDRKMELIWAVRRRSDLEWIHSELDSLLATTQRLTWTIRIFVTREDEVQANVAEREPPMGTPGKETFVKIERDEMSGTLDSASLSNVMEKGARGRSFLIEQATYNAAMRPETRHPDLDALVSGFVSSTVRGPTYLHASGPGGMTPDLKTIVAACNSGSEVWKGDEKYHVTLINDDRLEW